MTTRTITLPSSFAWRQLRQQPLGPVALNRSHPLAQGLVLSSYNCALDAVRPIYNYVSRTVGTTKAKTGSATTKVAWAPTFLSTNSAADQIQVDLSVCSLISVAWWMNWDAFGNDDKLGMEYTPTWNSNSGFLVDPDESGSGAFFVGISNGAAGNQRFTFTRPSALAWHHYVFTADKIAGTAIKMYMDGVDLALTPAGTGSAAGAFLAGSQLNVMSRNGASLFGSGKIQNINIYKRLLAPSEVIELYLDSYQMYVPSLPMETYVQAGTLKSLDGIARSSIKTINGIAIGSVKAYDGLTA